MLVNKRKILFIGESSFLATGFAVYWNEVIKRLHETGDFSIAELGSYASDGDPQIQSVPWKFYPVQPHPNDQRAQQIFRSKPTYQFGENRFDDVCIDFKPDLVVGLRDWWMDEFILRSPFRKNFKFCFDGRTPVLTPHGHKQISNINIGDMVLSMDGMCDRVVATSQHKTDKTMCAIRPSVWFEDIHCTEDHRLMAIKDSGRQWDKDKNKYFTSSEYYNAEMASWVEAKDLSEHDMLIFPREIPLKAKKNISLSKFTKRAIDTDNDLIRPKHKSHKGHWLKNCISINQNICRLFGYFIAEGSIGKGSVGFNFCKDEDVFIDDVQQIVKQELGLNCSVSTHKNVTRVSVCSVLLVDLFDSFYKNKYKCVPDFLMNCDNKLIECLINGMFRGDGCVTNTCHEQTTVEYFTNSEILCIQLWRLLNKLKIISNISYCPPRVNEIRIENRNIYSSGGFKFQIHGQYAAKIVSICNNPYWTSANFSKISRHPAWFDDKGNLIVRIKSIEHNTNTNQYVYDLTIENTHSFLVPFVAHNCWMPTIDGEPQKEIWLDSYKQCDGILTYSEYGMNLLEKTGRPGTNLIAIASPGADIEVFKPPVDKKAHKKRLGIDPNAIIIGTVMRNQKRKLYKDLIEAFSMWVYKAKSKGHTDLVRKTFLYLHTSYPDVGYDIGSAIKEFKIANKVIMTYLCAKCGTAFPARFSGSTMNCIKCSQMTAHPPNASHQCPRHILADIMKCFDLYVQYSVCEGFGMPVAEAQSCGVPTMAVNYSAMEDHLQCPTSIPIDVGRFFYEAIIETEQKRALPNNQDFVNKLDRFVKLSDAQRQELNKKTREYVVEPVDTYGSDVKMPRRSWDRTAAIWHKVLTECEIHDSTQTWERDTAQIYKPNLKPPKKQLTNGEFIKWVVGSVWNRPDMVDTFFAAEWLTALNLGFKTENGQRFNIDRQKVLDYFLNLIENTNRWEQKRVYSLDKVNPDKIGVITL